MKSRIPQTMMTMMEMSVVFKMPEPHGRNRCSVCMLDMTEMCPRSRGFVGRFMSETGYDTKHHTCHRFMITENERQTRYKEVLEKLHQNIKVDIN